LFAITHYPRQKLLKKTPEKNRSGPNREFSVIAAQYSNNADNCKRYLPMAARGLSHEFKEMAG
jgi:hypothetical protein